MATNTKKKTWLIVLLAIVALLFLAPMVTSWVDSDKDNNNTTTSTDSWLTVIDTDIKWEDGANAINLLSGTIKANVEVDALFVNVNGYGTEYLAFDVELVETSYDTYFKHTLTPTNGLLNTAFASDAVLTIDVYAEFEGRSYKLDTQKVSVSSVWTSLI